MRLFSTKKDRELYHQLQQNKTIDLQEVALYIKTAGREPIFCRNNNDDYDVLHATFFEQYHFPPINLPKHAVILDLGSNIGLTVRHLKCHYPGAIIIGVELDHENFLLAQKNT